jgi:cell wall-associated NlpC family hydrolase
VSELRSRPLRHALKQAAFTGVAGSVLVGAAVAGLAAPAVGSATAPRGAASAQAGGTVPASTASVKLQGLQLASSTRRVVNRSRELRTAASLRGRPYRYGAAGPWAFDCSGYVQYVLKQQGIGMNRTAAAQYRQTAHISRSAARPGDLVFFYGSAGVYHVGIFAGGGRMWVAPHTGTVVQLEKIYGNNWLIGRIV